MIFEQWLQSRLTSHGYAVGPIDGVIGPVTIAALKAFQRSCGIDATGLASAVTVAALRAASIALPAAAERPAGASPGVLTPVTIAPWPRQKDVEAFYGERGANLTKIGLPYAMKMAWDRRRLVTQITLHEKVARSAELAFARIADAYTAEQRGVLGIDVFSGSFNIRRMRGGNAWSMHSWGIAIDFDNTRNQLAWGRDKARLGKPDAEAFWKIWEGEGWLSLGRARNYDWMHVQAARL